MNLIRFAFNNVIRNKKAYFAYFLSCSIAATVFFSFTMFILHPNLDTNEFTDDVKLLFITTEVAAYVFLVLFLFYSVSVFLKNRNKEFGIFFIIGISKKQLGKLIFIENTFIIGVAALVGIIFGMSSAKFFLVVISQFMSLYGLNFYFPNEAILITLGCFLLIGVLISFFVYFSIKENQVLKLLKGSITPKKEPRTSVIFIIIPIIFLGVSYYLSVTAKIEQLDKLIRPVTIATIIATYFVYSQLSVFILRFLKKNRIIYMKKTNLIWISNLFYRVKDNVIMFFIITITSAVAFTSIGAIYAYKNSVEKSTINDNPQAITYIITEVSNKDDYYKTTSNEKHKENIKFIEDSLKKDGFNYTKFVAERKMYINSSEGSVNVLTVMPESEYNKLASSLNLKTINLKGNEAFKVAKDNRIYSDIDPYKPFTINGEKFKVVGEGKKNVLTSIYTGAYVIRNELFNKMKNYSSKESYYAFYVKEWYKTLNTSKRISDKFRSYEKLKSNDEYINYYIKSSALEYERNRQHNGLIMLAALFIGIIFFFTTGSFLYNKFYMDAVEDKNKFKNMNKIGLTYKDIKKIITIELGCLFLIPYIIAMVHSSFALSALKSAYNIEVTMSAFVVMGSFFLIQIVYFIVIRAVYLKEIKREVFKF